MEKEINSAGNAISEAVSENKRRRGRPTVFERDHMEDFDRLITGAYREKTRRTIVAHYYCSAVFGILEDHNDIPYLEGIFRIDGNACIEKCEIIEQLGRMHVQDGYGEDTVIYAATLAARFYHNGNSVKEIAAYLRRVRKAKSWDV